VTLGGVTLALSLTVVALTAPGCSGGKAGDRANRGAFEANLISTGLGQIFPYRIRELDSFGNPTTTVLNIESMATLKANVNANNGVLPVAAFATVAQLPDGSPGNHFIQMRFSHKLQVESILSDQLAGQTNSGLTTAVTLLGYNPVTESASVLLGRGFVGGVTYFNRGGRLERVEAVEADPDTGLVVINDGEATGFPNYAGAADLVAANTFTFVADSDNNLSTIETFPANVLIQIVVSNAVRDSDGKVLEQELCTATTVGPDPNPPDVLGFSPNKKLAISPGNGEANVSPTTSILVRFNKPVQPGDVGFFFDPKNLIPPTGGATIEVTEAANTFQVIYYADPLGYADMCNYRITPAYNLPGRSQIKVAVSNTTIRGLGGAFLGNAVNTTFNTADGPGIVNAPVAPEAIYVGISGPSPGVSVIDLNGFGQGTGDINNTRFPLNKNLRNPGVIPPLAEGKTNTDAGSGGALKLVKDTAGNTRLIRGPLVSQVGDIQIGAPLDLVFNNENVNVNASRSNQMNPVSFLPQIGNPITTVPHPNPPKLRFPPPNPARAIFGEEPSATSSAGPPGNVVTGGPPCVTQPVNLMVTGNPFSNNAGEVGIFGTFSTGTFNGPQPPPASPPPPTPFCAFTQRQQIGHFLYVLDRDNRQILVLNSNRFTVLDTIRVADPVDLAMSPNLRVLAVTNFSSSSVTFIDINPLSPNFHTVIAETRVAPGPTEIAWQPDGEDVLVISRSPARLTILNSLDFSVRRSISGFLNDPIGLAVSERYFIHGNQSGVYYAYILNGNGDVAVYESGPDGVNGIGFNDFIGTVGINLRGARAVINDPTSSLGAVMIAHLDQSGSSGQVSRVELVSSPVGQFPTTQNSGGFIVPPTFRQKEWKITQRFGGSDATTPVKDLMSGRAPVDIALDEMINVGASVDLTTPFNTTIPQSPMGHSAKGNVKQGLTGLPTIPYQPKLVFVAVADRGVVDVFEIATGRKLSSIDAPGVAVVASYWRQ
jgi:hypothetical protein